MPFVQAKSAAWILAAASLLQAQCVAGQVLQPDERPKLFTADTTRRAQTLLKQMTLDEKIGQMEQMFAFAKSAAMDERIRDGRLGSALFVTDPAEINRLQHIAVDTSRLHIPLLFGFDVVHGFRTIYPVPLAMAATWNPALVARCEGMAASEARSAGILWAFGPMVDIARDPRWGRIVEGAGEDPFLGSAIATAEVKGLQGDALGAPGHIMACAKHFAGYGAAEGGRDYDAANISDAQLENVYLKPFRAAVQAGVGTLMSAYMDLNDVPATANRFLLTDTLRNAWHFDGFVVSDANAVKSLEAHGFAASPEDAARRAVSAGIDMEMSVADPAFDSLHALIGKHQISEGQIDEAVLPILESKFQLGLFEHPFVDETRTEGVLSDPAHRVIAREAAEQAAVLLRNEGGVLPLHRDSVHTVALIGPTGGQPMDLIGPWAFQEKVTETVTLLDGLREKLGSAAHVDYEPGVQISRRFPSMFDQIFHITAEPAWSASEAESHFQHALAIARNADVILLTMGEYFQMSGENASNSTLDLPGEQDRLMRQIVALHKPVVLLLQNGRPLNITWASENVPAILDIWYPGSQGGRAVANLLFGDANPSGHLPLTWPRDVGQIPINYAHNLTQDPSKQGERYWSEPSTPLFPFGFGLSYSRFTFENLRVSSQSPDAHGSVEIAIDVQNQGAVAGETVVQVYVHQRSGRASRPVRELKAFQRVALKAGEKMTVKLAIAKSDLRYWSAADRDWVADLGDFDVWAGDSATAELHGSFVVTPVGN